MNWRDWRVPRSLIWILALSVALRLAASIYLGNQVDALPGTADQVSYHALALRVVAGHGFSFEQNWWPLTKAGEPTAHWSFLYVFFLSFVYSLFGAQPIAARILQAIFSGICQPLFVFLLGRELFDLRTGIAAAALTGVYGYFIYYSATLMTETFFICAMLLALYLAVRTMKARPTLPNQEWQLGLALGAALGTGVLLRQLLLLLVPGILLWVWWYSGRRMTRGVVIASAVVAAMILPFTIYNWARFDQFVLLNTNAGFAFFWANHPIYGTHFVPILTQKMGSYANLIPWDLRGLNEAALDRALLKIGLGFVREDFLRYLLLSVSRIPVYFQFWPSGSSSAMSNVVRVGSFGLALPLMLVGFGLSVRSMWVSGDSAFRSGVGLLILFAGSYTLLHLLSWALIRYRLPVDAVMLVFAGAAVIWLRDTMLGRFARPRNAGRLLLDQS